MRQPDFSTTARAERSPLWQRLALAACAALALAAVVQAARTRAEARSAADGVARVRREVDEVRSRVRALEARAALRDAGMLAPEDASPARVVADVAALLPGAVRLERLSIDYRRGGALELAVVARDASAWDGLLSRLERAERLREVVPGPEARAAEVRSLVRARVASETR